MGGGNGAKAAQKRERNQKDAKGSAKSQLKANVAAMDIQCVICKATFLRTSREKALNEHASNKHSKTVADCFPTFQGEAAK
ncbi:At2g23090 like protein [Phialemonium atrogriseum]|uniref:At2g23090 like protein n=1 Tax=Phialemonium atrogriseum TaxID=1093897 RepID=A0AAJ0FNC5_9PEZI|nr:At2g23090 like protein [Phialemonium atrogriseum]KAK1767010.1 At2g23090 like protein [Phialemonium atrogriseum]